MASSLSERAIVSLAVLKVNWDTEKRDYIEFFVPFVLECLVQMNEPVVSTSELQASILGCFGINIPQGALKTILQRMTRKGLIKIEKGKLVDWQKSCADRSLVSVRDGVVRQHEALIAKIIDFCARQHEVQWTQQNAESALLAYLSEHSAAILAATISGQPIAVPSKPSAISNHLIHSFLQETINKDPEGFQYLEAVIKGNMLANVLMFDLGAVGQRFDRTEIYFDTGFLLGAIGAEGDAIKKACRELLDMLYQLGAELRCFEHNLNEVRGVLHGAAHNIGRSQIDVRNAGATLLHFIDIGCTPSDIELMIAQLERSLKQCRVEVRPTPPYEISLGIDEDALTEQLHAEVGYRHEDTLQRDIESISAIFRLRRGQAIYHLERSKAIFVTTNTALARSVTRFFRMQYPETAQCAPVCISDSVLATLAWLKMPTQFPDLPRKRIIADCYAAMNVSDVLWRQYVQEMDRLREDDAISDDDVHLLLYSTSARKELLDLTHGDPAAVTMGTIDDVIRRVRAEERKDLEESLEHEITRREDAERNSAEAAARAVSLIESFELKCSLIAIKVGRVVATAAFIIAFLLIAAGTYITLPMVIPTLPELMRIVLAPIFSVFVALLAFFNLVYGASVQGIARWIEVRVARVVESILLRIFQDSGLHMS